MSVSGNQNFPISFAAIERSFCRRARIDSRRTRATRANRRYEEHRARKTGCAFRATRCESRKEERVELSEYNNRRGVAEWKFIGGRLMLLIGPRSIFEKRVDLAPIDRTNRRRLLTIVERRTDRNRRRFIAKKKKKYASLIN